jgi:hypothetical protein
MNEEARQRLNELRKERRGDLARNAFAISSGITTVIMALVLYFVVDGLEKDTAAYVQTAQQTVKGACQAAEGNPLPATVQRDCQAAGRNELPQVLQSVVDNPDPDDPENQDSEIQESEVQDSETQDPEVQDTEGQDPEAEESEIQDPELQEEEVQEPEIQEPEIQDPEEQGAPVCPAGYERGPYHWFGPDGVDNTGDEEDWLVCKKVV